MKKNLHPQNHAVIARCTCGNKLNVISTEKELDIDICSACHPFYTGQHKFIDTAGRIEKFQKKFAANQNIKTTKKATKK
ncbi:MAG: 50S ribosomal protein L31 [bacterium]